MVLRILHFKHTPAGAKAIGPWTTFWVIKPKWAVSKVTSVWQTQLSFFSTNFQRSSPIILVTLCTGSEHLLLPQFPLCTVGMKNFATWGVCGLHKVTGQCPLSLRLQMTLFVIPPLTVFYFLSFYVKELRDAWAISSSSKKVEVGAVE